MTWLVEWMKVLPGLAWALSLVPGRRELHRASWLVLRPGQRQRFSRLVERGWQRASARSRHDRSAAGGYCRHRAGLAQCPRDESPMSVPPGLRPRLPGLLEPEQDSGKTDCCSLLSLG